MRRSIKMRLRPEAKPISISDLWFAWYPVRLQDGGIAFGRRLWRNRCNGQTLYREVSDFPPEYIEELKQAGG